MVSCEPFFFCHAAAISLHPLPSLSLSSQHNPLKTLLPHFPLLSRHKWFAQPLGLKDSQCIIFGHRKSDGKPAKQTQVSQPCQPCADRVNPVRT